MATVDREKAYARARAFAGDGFNPYFETMLIEGVQRLLSLGMTKEQIIKFIDLAAEARAGMIARNVNDPKFNGSDGVS